jgi:hypothetical protein
MMEMDYYNIGLVVGFAVVIMGIIMGWGENRKIVVFRDYNDLGLTFLIPAAFVVINLLFTQFFHGDARVGMAVSGTVAAGLTVLLLVNTFKDNQGNLLKTLLAFLTKIPLGIIWVLNLFTLLNPQGKNSRQRAQSRGIALIILTVLTPIIAMLVVDRDGSAFNPKNWLKGRRGVGGIRNHL